jgi:hypothetical protein
MPFVQDRIVKAAYSWLIFQAAAPTSRHGPDVTQHDDAVDAYLDALHTGFN